MFLAPFRSCSVHAPTKWFLKAYRMFMVLVEPFHINLDNSKWPYIYIKFDPPKMGGI